MSKPVVEVGLIVVTAVPDIAPTAQPGKAAQEAVEAVTARSGSKKICRGFMNSLFVGKLIRLVAQEISGLAVGASNVIPEVEDRLGESATESIAIRHTTTITGSSPSDRWFE